MREQLVRAIRMVGVVTVPSAVALLLFGPLITEVLFLVSVRMIRAISATYYLLLVSALSHSLST